MPGRVPGPSAHEADEREWMRYADEAFSRNIGLLSHEEQDAMGRAKVAIPGMGGVGGLHLLTHLRLGVRRFHLADFDTYETANMNRQVGATLSSMGKPKLEVMARQARDLNPCVELELFPQGLNPENLDAFLHGVDVVIDSLDFFEFDMRRAMFNRARELGIPVVTAGPMGFSSALLVFTKQGMSFDEYFDIRPGLTREQQYLRFGLGLTPRPTHIRYMDMSRVSLKRKKGPSLFIACELCAALAATETVRIVSGRGGVRPAPHYLQFDPFTRSLRRGVLRGGNRHPLQRLKAFVVSNFLMRDEERIGHQRPKSPGLAAGVTELTDEALRYIIAAGIAAPSGDNKQPWRFEAQGSRVSARIDPEADRSFFNFRQIASLVSLGAAVENMALAAGSLGFKAETVVCGGEAAEVNVITEFSPSDSRPDELSGQIWERCTNRRMYRRRPLDAALALRIEASAKEAGPCSLRFVTGGQALKDVARAVFLADRIRTEHRGLHEYFTSMVRFNREDALKSRDGLPLENLYAGAAGEVFLKATRPWPAMHMANRLGLGRLVALHSAQGIMHSAGVCLLTVPGRSARDFVVGGRALERAWLRLTHLGLSMQPMTAITLFLLRLDMEGESAFSPGHADLLRQASDLLCGAFGAPGLSREAPVMLFRLGHARPIRFGTFRREPDSFLAG